HPLRCLFHSAFQSLFHQRDGELTRDLLLAPGRFGLGKIPEKRKPDATTTMTCGYCSTGCGLNIHLKDGQAIGLTPATDYPGSLAKFGTRIVHGDGNTRQCMATSVVAYKQSFGFDAPPYTYQDFEESDVIVLVGSNLCIAHPILWERVCRNPHSPHIIVVDPR